MRKIDSPFSTGLQAKIYWCIYLKPSNGYDIGKIVYGKPKNPSTAKIYPNLAKMEKLGYIKSDNQGIYRVEIDPLVSHLDEILVKQNLNFNESERFYLTCILDSTIFKNWFSILYNPLHMHEIPHKQANFIDGITSVLAFSATHVLQSLEDNPDEKGALSEFYHHGKKTLPDSVLKKIQPFNQKNLYRGLIRIFDQISEDPENKKWSKIFGHETMNFFTQFKNGWETHSKKIQEELRFSTPQNMGYPLIFWFYIGILTPETILRKMEVLSSTSMLARFQRFFMKIGEINFHQDR